MSANSKTIEPTDEQIDAAILAALAETADDLQPWAAVRRRLPGPLDRKGERLIALWATGRVWLCKVGGGNFVILGDADDERNAAAAKAEGRVRAPVVL